MKDEDEKGALETCVQTEMSPLPKKIFTDV